MATEYALRMGDGKRVFLTKEKIMAEIEAGTANAADLGEIPALSGNEIEKLAEILMMPGKAVSVEQGMEVPVTHDIGTIRLDGDQGNSGVGIPSSRLVGCMVHERAFGADTMELGHIDYSFKPVKPVVSNECQAMEVCQQNMIIPLFYGAMPNMGLYYTPDGPFENPGDLMKAFKIQEAWDSMEHAAEHLTRDTVWVMQKLFASGADGVNFDTTAAAGDADMYGTLHAIEALRKEFPDMYIEAGMAGEWCLVCTETCSMTELPLQGSGLTSRHLCCKSRRKCFRSRVQHQYEQDLSLEPGTGCHLHEGSCRSVSNSLSR